MIGQPALAISFTVLVLSCFEAATAGQPANGPCVNNSDCNSGYCSPLACGSNFCGGLFCVGNSPTITIKTWTGNFVTAESLNGGGLSGSDAAMNTNRTKQLGWETFTCVPASGPTNSSPFGLKTSNGQWVTAIWGGGVGGPDADPWEIQTNRTQALAWETFTLVTSNVNPNSNSNSFSCALKTSNGLFVTAVNGGGYGNNDTANKFPIHTNATWAVPGPWEIFFFNFQ
jgi:hypothetical protein